MFCLCTQNTSKDKNAPVIIQDIVEESIQISGKSNSSVQTIDKSSQSKALQIIRDRSGDSIIPPGAQNNDLKFIVNLPPQNDIQTERLLSDVLNIFHCVSMDPHKATFSIKTNASEEIFIKSTKSFLIKYLEPKEFSQLIQNKIHQILLLFKYDLNAKHLIISQITGSEDFLIDNLIPCAITFPEMMIIIKYTLVNSFISNLMFSNKYIYGIMIDLLANKVYIYTSVIIQSRNSNLKHINNQKYIMTIEFFIPDQSIKIFVQPTYLPEEIVHNTNYVNKNFFIFNQFISLINIFEAYVISFKYRTNEIILFKINNQIIEILKKIAVI